MSLLITILFGGLEMQAQDYDVSYQVKNTKEDRVDVKVRRSDKKWTYYSSGWVEEEYMGVVFGRWNAGKIPYATGSHNYMVDGKNRQDAWNGGPNGEPATIYDFQGVNNYAPDGFQYHNIAQNDGLDENYNDGTGGFFDLGGWDGAVESHTTFDIPCRGGYVYFEPAKNGTLTVYLLQNGCVDFYDKEQDKNEYQYINGVRQNTRHAKNAPTGYVSWRPVFITDEQGNEIEIPASNRVAVGGTRMNYSDYKAYVDYYGNNKKKQGIYLRESPHVNPKYVNWMTNGVNTSNGVWTPSSSSDETNPWPEDGVGNRVTRVPKNLGGGYVSVIKAYTRYTFPVKAGKTYFVFSNHSKIGFCGYGFKADATQPTSSLEISNNQSGVSFSNGTQYRQVTLTGRTFNANTWTSLCLPFSVSINQMRIIFGENVETVHFNHIGEEDHVAYFDRHVYDQMIVAGVPVFIKPSVDVSNPTFYNVTVESPEPKNVYSEQYGYTFKGVYGSEDMGAYGYFINDKLYWLKDKTMGSGSMRAYFKATSDNTEAGAKALANISFTKVYEDSDSETTGIVEILSEGTARESNTLFDIYNLNGIKVRRQATSTEGLPKGIYVVNGKKVTVK